jgi:hypothetical protein
LRPADLYLEQATPPLLGTAAPFIDNMLLAGCTVKAAIGILIAEVSKFKIE